MNNSTAGILLFVVWLSVPCTIQKLGSPFSIVSSLGLPQVDSFFTLHYGHACTRDMSLSLACMNLTFQTERSSSKSLISLPLVNSPENLIAPWLPTSAGEQQQKGARITVSDITRVLWRHPIILLSNWVHCGCCKLWSAYLQSTVVFATSLRALRSIVDVFYSISVLQWWMGRTNTQLVLLFYEVVPAIKNIRLERHKHP